MKNSQIAVENFQIPPDFVNQVLQDSIATFSVADQVTCLIKKITGQWRKFVEEPIDYKRQFTLGKDGCRGWRQGTRKEKKDARSNDGQELFHFHKDYVSRLESKKIDYSKYSKLFLDLGDLYQISVEASLQIAGLLDKRLPGREIKRQIKKCNTKNKSWHMIRLLYCPKNNLTVNEQQYSADTNAHFNRNAWTFSFIGTAPALRLGLHLEKEYEHQEGRVIFFAGAKLEKQTARTIDMVRNSVVVEKSKARTVLDFFAHTALSEKITQLYVNKREKEFGFL
ncbi:hypothetical protein IPN41_00490 [Candidatus Falkowbacteria bacterium]|nr:MAG: hypothetical protein IPN41_00490 [Candidatus Falkowbacteria bacterium]